MTKIELEADNIVLISIIEKNIETMQRAARMLSLLQSYQPSLTPATEECIGQLKVSAAGSREFLDRIFNEGNYPQKY